MLFHQNNNIAERCFLVVIIAIVAVMVGLWSSSKTTYTGTITKVVHHVDSKIKHEAHNTVFVRINHHTVEFTDQTTALTTFSGKDALAVSAKNLHHRYRITATGFPWESDVPKNIIKLEKAK